MSIATMEAVRSKGTGAEPPRSAGRRTAAVRWVDHSRFHIDLRARLLRLLINPRRDGRTHGFADLTLGRSSSGSPFCSL